MIQLVPNFALSTKKRTTMRKLSIRKTDIFEDFEAPAKENNSTAVVAKPKSILEAFEHIVEQAEGSRLSEEFFEQVLPLVKYASRKLKLGEIQTVLLAIFVDRSEDRRIMLSEIASFLKCRTTKILRLANFVDDLERHHYIRASRNGDSVTYRVPMKVLAALRENHPYVHTEEPIEDTQTFFDRFAKLMKEMDNNEVGEEQLRDRTFEMLGQIPNTVFARSLKGLGVEDDEVGMLFIYMAHLYIQNNDDAINFNDIENIFDDDEIPAWLKRALRSRRMILFNQKLIENAQEDGMGRPDTFKLTDYAKTEVLAELNIAQAGKSQKGLIDHQELAEKNLIYNAAESKQVAELASILEQDRFAKVQQRMEAAGMRKGFCCIFYGAPGTGKTETVYQLAKRTGRNIMRVDVDKIKSCWVGESEKNIKALFDRYRNICRNADVAPILLFNEADAVLGVRMEGASRAVDKMENSIQNIILQEMETLDGILIATTNLTSNLDKAFERRFLYKIKYEKPTAQARAQIWKIMLPELSDDQADRLGNLFDLSGGEIENIVRRNTVNWILNGDQKVNMDRLEELCSHERITTARPQLGFSA